SCDDAWKGRAWNREGRLRPVRARGLAAAGGRPASAVALRELPGLSEGAGSLRAIDAGPVRAGRSAGEPEVGSRRVVGDRVARAPEAGVEEAVDRRGGSGGGGSRSRRDRQTPEHAARPRAGSRRLG